MVEREDALRALQQVEAVRGRARTQVRSTWFPCLVFGFLTLLSAPVGLRWGGPAIGAYWLVAAPLGIGVVARWSVRRERRAGLEGPVLPYALTAAAIVAAAFAAGAFGSAAVQVAGPPLAVSLGHLWLARIDREPVLAAVALGLAVLVLGVVALRLPGAPALLAVAYGAVFTATGLVLRAREGLA